MSLLQQELERSFGEGPALRPVDAVVQSGRRALRRRRLGVAASTLAVVAALGTGYAVSGVGAARSTTGEVVTDPTPAPTPSPSRDAEPEPTKQPWVRGDTVRYTVDGQLEIRPGVEVHEHIENPFDYRPPERSDAFDLTYDGRRMWVIVETREDAGGSTSISEPSRGWASFADYVADQSGAEIVRNGWPATVRLTDEGVVVPVAGAEILQRTDDPRLGDAFAPPGTLTGAALLLPAGEDQAHFVVWRVVDGTLDVIPTHPAEVVGATFQQLLTYARSQYASGEGLR